MIEKLYHWHLQFRSDAHLRGLWAECTRTFEFDTLIVVNKIMHRRMDRIMKRLKK